MFFIYAEIILKGVIGDIIEYIVTDQEIDQHIIDLSLEQRGWCLK